MRCPLLFAAFIAAGLFSANAEDAESPIFLSQEVDVSFETTSLRLAALGYRDVKLVQNTNPLHLTAVNSTGTNVGIDVNPQSGIFTEAEQQ